MKLIKFFFLFYLISFSTKVLAQLSSGQIDSLVQSAMSSFNVAGAAVAVVKDGKVIYEKGYGVKSIVTRQQVDENTNFQIASNTKAFITTALSILIDEGKLKWTDKVRDYLPEFKMYNDYVTENFLVEDLLCHRSGLGLGAGDLMDFPDGADFTIRDKLTFAQYLKPVSAFRTQWDYDNQLYVVAGELLARVSGMSWEKFVQTRILDALQMTNSFSAQTAMKDQSNMATPHSTITGKIKAINLYYNPVIGAAGGIISNVHDMSKWMIMQLNGGKYGNNLENQVFSPARQRDMWRIHTVQNANPDPRYNSHFAGYGLGWGLTDIKGNLSVSHTGGLPGMLSKVSLIPDLKLGIVILTNTENGGAALFSAVNNSIVDSYLGLNKIDYVAKYIIRMQAMQTNRDSITTDVWKQVEAMKKTKINPLDYIGVYEDKWFGQIEVFLKGDQLWFKSYRSPKLNGPMNYYNANTFAIQWEYQDMNCDAFALFSLDENGTAQRIMMKGISPDIDFSFDFQDLDLQRINK